MNTSASSISRAPLAALLALWFLSAAGLAQQHDVVIRGGRVLDGAGNPWVEADIAIDDGRFAIIGRVTGQGRREIDATGLYVSPGWIDMMDQSGSVLLRSGLAENKLRMGVTTAIGGEGGTPSVTGEGDWKRAAREVRAYFDRLAEVGISINFGSYYSAIQPRLAVLGTENRRPNDEELDEMKALMRAAMQAGAMGMTTALIYPPGSYADTDELVALATVAADHGGLYASHIRGEGKELVSAVSEAIEIGERSGAPVEIFHFKAAYQPGWGTLVHEAIEAIEAARQRGVDVAADVYPYTAGGTGIEATIPAWAHEGGGEALRERLQDPAMRQRWKRELETGSPGWWNIIEASGGWQNVVLVNARNEQNARWHGRSIAEIAEASGKDPADTAWDLVLEGEGRVLGIFHMMHEDDIASILRQPWVSIGSDAGAALEAGGTDFIGLPHPRAYGTHPRILARYVRELKVLSLEDAIRKMTSWPAARMGLVDRGVIREGLWADVVIFDPQDVQDRATYEAPQEFPIGIPYVLVNGEVVIDAGRHSGAKPGRVLFGKGRVEVEEP